MLLDGSRAQDAGENTATRFALTAPPSVPPLGPIAASVDGVAPRVPTSASQRCHCHQPARRNLLSERQLLLTSRPPQNRRFPAPLPLRPARKDVPVAVHRRRALIFEIGPPLQKVTPRRAPHGFHHDAAPTDASHSSPRSGLRRGHRLIAFSGEARDILRQLHEGLHDASNATSPASASGRKWDAQYQCELSRDARRVNDYASRRHIHPVIRLATPELHCRFQ